MSEGLSYSIDFIYNDEQILNLQLANRPVTILDIGVDNFLENYSQTLVINDSVAESEPYRIVLPSSPNIGVTYDILQGKNNDLSIDGNEKKLNLVYIKVEDNVTTILNESAVVVHKGSEYDENFVSNYSIIFNGVEWVMTSNVVLYDITV